MKKIIILSFLLCVTLQAKAWWDPGHLLVAMIAYMQLNDKAKSEVDRLTQISQRDYPYLNHFIALGAWPDDLKAEGVRSYDTWHYTNIPYNPDGLTLPDKQKVDVIWAISQMQKVLGNPVAKDIDKSRHLGFLVHFVGDIHQPLHTTTFFSDENPSGDQSGNEFYLKGDYRNLHSFWDDGAGLLTSMNDISPYGEPKKKLSPADIERYQELAKDFLKDIDRDACNFDQVDPDFWALESHKLAVKYGYRGISGKNDRGRETYLRPGDEPSELYIDNAQAIVKSQIVTAGLRLGQILNEIYGKEK